jgi:hypothetical protein
MAEELASALNLSTLPKPYQDLYKIQSKVSKDLTEAETSIEKFKYTREADAITQQKKAYDEATEKYQKRTKEEQDKLDSFGDVKFQPTQDNVVDIAGLFSAVGIIGAMIGGSGRNSAMNALSSMTGMLDGWKQGRADLFKKEKINFDANLNKIKLEKDAIRDKMNAIAKEMVVDKEKADINYKVLLSQYPDSVFKKMDEVGGFKNALAFVNGPITKATDQMVKHKDDMQMESIKQANRMKVAAAERQTALMSKIDREVLNEARAYPNLNLENLTNISKEGTKRIVGGLDQLRETEHTVDFIQKNPNAVGALAKLRNVINLDALKSINTGDEFNDAVSRSASIDKNIDDATKKGRISRDEAQAAKILQKQLFTLALADVQASGQRGTVYLDKQFQGLYDQASNIDTLLKILHEREISADRRLQVFDMGVDNRSDKNQFGFYLTGPDQWLNQRFPVLAPEQVEAKIKDKSLKSGDWFRDKKGQMRQIK